MIDKLVTIDRLSQAFSIQTGDAYFITKSLSGEDFAAVKANDPSFVTYSEDLLWKFVEWKLEDFDHFIMEDDAGVMRAMNLVAKNARRGMANFRYKDWVFYSSTFSAYDVPFFITLNNGEYKVFLHPDYTKYGQKLVAQ